MEQTKNEPKNENKAAPDNGKPKKERKPLTEAQRLKRQKMIVLPAIVLVFIGAMWLIFAPSSDKEQQPGTGGYNIEMPDADKANRQIIGDKAKAYEQGAMEERQENRSRAMQELGDMFDREVAETDGGRATFPFQTCFRMAASRIIEHNKGGTQRLILIPIDGTFILSQLFPPLGILVMDTQNGLIQRLPLVRSRQISFRPCQTDKKRCLHSLIPRSFSTDVSHPMTVLISLKFIASSPLHIR